MGISHDVESWVRTRTCVQLVLMVPLSATLPTAALTEERLATEREDREKTYPGQRNLPLTAALAIARLWSTAKPKSTGT